MKIEILIDKRINYLATLDVISGKIPEIFDSTYHAEQRELFTTAQIEKYKRIMSLGFLHGVTKQRCFPNQIHFSYSAQYDAYWENIKLGLELFATDLKKQIQDLKKIIVRLNSALKFPLSIDEKLTIYLLAAPVSGALLGQNAIMIDYKTKVPIPLLVAHEYLHLIIFEILDEIVTRGISEEEEEHLINFIISKSGCLDSYPELKTHLEQLTSMANDQFIDILGT